MRQFSRLVASTAILLMVILPAGGCRFYFKTSTDSFSATKNQGSMENGRNLVFNICGGCHYNHPAGKFIGQSLNDLPGIAGHLYSANLTNSKSHGIPPRYTDAELFYLLKTGISKNGRFMPYMMRPMMADADVNDIIIYLRSGDGPVSAGDTTVGKTRINMIGKIGIRAIAGPQLYTRNVSRPPKNDAVADGRYLVALIGCFHCHSEKTLKLDFLEPEKTKGYLAGGMKLKDPDGHAVHTPNLTPDDETGIGTFTRDDFAKAVREGITKGGRKLSPPMDKFDHLTDTQVNDIYTYLRSLPPQHHEVRR
jgi:mono/diheme cytochrome c family protein